MPKPYLLIYDLPNPYDLVVLIPQFLALAGIIWSFRYFSLSEFLGISQVIRWKKGFYKAEDLDEKMTLRIQGPYKYSRHPLYFFIISFLLFRPAMNLFGLIFLICATAYFYIGSVYEEKKLIEIFGEEYRLYKTEVPRIIPFRLSKPYTRQVFIDKLE
jgi:protein-S-isoprenylcysteine O-methyltransferase Ste14